MLARTVIIALALGHIALPALAQTTGTGQTEQRAHAGQAAPNQVLGTWRMVSARLDPDRRNLPVYGENPAALLVFTPDMHFVEVLTDADTPRFASDVRGEGTDAENRMALDRSIGFFGTYTVDEKGEFSGNRVQGATFPNWVGSVRTRNELTLTVEGDRMTEDFRRPEGTRIRIEWERVK